MNSVYLQENSINKLGIIFVVIIAAIARFIFIHPGLGEPDAYREAFSALQYLEQGTFSFYWDHPLSMWILVVISYFAQILHTAPHIIANILAVTFGSLTLFPWMWSINILAGVRVSLAWSLCLALNPVFIYYSTYWNHENTGMFFLALAFACWIWSLRSNKKERFFIFGTFYGLALTSRHYYALGLLPALAFAFYLLKDKEEISLKGLATVIPAVLLTLAVLVPRDTIGAWVGDSYFIFISWQGYVKHTLRLVWNDLGGVIIAGPIFCLLIWLKGFKKEVLFAAGWVLPYFLFCLNFPAYSRYLLVTYMGLWYVVVLGCNILFMSDRNMIRCMKPNKEMFFAVVLLIFLLGSSWSSASPVRVLKKNMLNKINHDQIIADEITKRVGKNLLLIYSWQPILLYYNFDKYQRNIYVIKRLGNKKILLKGVHEVVEDLNKGLPVYATRLALRFYRSASFQVEADPVWEYENFQLFKITQIKLDNSQS